MKSQTNKRSGSVCIISPEFPPHTNWGGAATFNSNLASLLTGVFDKVFVITYDGKGEKEKNIKKGNLEICYIKLRSDNKLFNFLYYRFPFGLLRNLLQHYLPDLAFIIDWNVFCYLRFRSINFNNKIHLIHTVSYNIPAMLVKIYFRKIKLIVHNQGDLSILKKYEKKSISYFIQEQLENLYFLKFADLIICCSRDVRKKMLQKYPYLEKRCVSIPNFIDVRKIKAVKNINKNKIIFFGRIEYRKGTDLLINSFARIAKTNKNAQLYLIGEKRNNFIFKNEFVDFDFYLKKQLPDKLKNRVHHYPLIKDQTDLFKLLRKLKGIVVMPSRYEPFGFVIIESWALGLPVVAGNSGGGKEIITNNETGFLFVPDTGSLTNTLKKVTKMDIKKLSVVTKNARKKLLNNYDFKSVFDSYSSMYEKLKN